MDHWMWFPKFIPYQQGKKLRNPANWYYGKFCQMVVCPKGKGTLHHKCSRYLHETSTIVQIIAFMKWEDILMKVSPYTTANEEYLLPLNLNPRPSSHDNTAYQVKESSWYSFQSHNDGSHEELSPQAVGSSNFMFNSENVSRFSWIKWLGITKALTFWRQHGYGWLSTPFPGEFQPNRLCSKNTITNSVFYQWSWEIVPSVITNLVVLVSGWRALKA